MAEGGVTVQNETMVNLRVRQHDSPYEIWLKLTVGLNLDLEKFMNNSL